MIIKARSREKQKITCTGIEFKEMLTVATNWLEKNASAIDALNVFPVPDGDTGTNMLLTMRSAMDEVAHVSGDSAYLVVQAMARGSLMGARGNSGVILSQVFKGLAQGMGNVVSFGADGLAYALQQASLTAYKGLSRPVEGTMLTVTKDVAKAVQAAAKNTRDLVDLMEVAVDEAKASVERTPELLDVLKEAGVVDAGAQGIYIMMDGILHYLRGEADKVTLLQPTIAPATLPPALTLAKVGKRKDGLYGYCTELIIRGKKLNPDHVRRKIAGKGDSVIVVGDDTTVKLHIHTTNPGDILHYGTSLGSLHDIKVQNMDDQHEEFVQMRRSLMPVARIATVVVASGEGLEDVFRSLGATAIVPGHLTMNPSTEELLRAVEFVPSDRVIILPNDKNVILAAQQAASLSKKRVQVLQTKSAPQGIAALLAFKSDAALESNITEMEKARQQIKCIEVTTAVRGARLGKLKVKKGQYIAFLDGNLKVAGNAEIDVVDDAIIAAGGEDVELVTLYYGAAVTAEEAQDFAAILRERHPNLQVELVKGDQPNYNYIISLE